MPLPADFVGHMGQLALQARNNAIASCLPGVAKRSWSMPKDYDILGIDVENPDGFIEGYKRNYLNEECVAEYNLVNPNEGRRGVIMALKTAIDYMAAYERAMHARFANGVRCRAWASARRAGLGHDVGIFGNVSACLEDLIAASRAVDSSEPT